MMNTTSATRLTTPVALRPRSLRRTVEGETDGSEAESHADEARDQERAAAEAIDEGDRDESRDHVDRADRPGGGVGSRGGDLKPAAAKMLSE